MSEPTFAEVAIAKFKADHPEAMAVLMQLPEADREAVMLAWIRASVSLVSMTPDELAGLAELAASADRIVEVTGHVAEWMKNFGAPPEDFTPPRPYR